MFTGAPGTQTPALQTSSVVHVLPSSHGAALFVRTQDPPVQVSSVHGLPSSQSAACAQSNAMAIVVLVVEVVVEVVVGADGTHPG
jgi:hypothetical protein